MNSIKPSIQAIKQNQLHGFGYIAAATISIIHVFPKQMLLMIIGILIPTIILILFLHTIFSKLKINIIDMSVTLFGIFYIAIFLMFISIIRENLENGKFLIWYLFFAAWGTDIFAYIIGKNFGKHHFTDISPNKTIEGCIGGIIGAVILVTLYTLTCQYIFHVEFNYIIVILISLVLSVLSQIGDLSASAVKRYTGIKDFSNLIPGHGGMLDRIDSIVFIAPFAYFLFMLLV